MKSVTLTVIARYEQAGSQAKYVGQCVEYDICVQGNTLKQVLDRFHDAVVGHLTIAKKLGKEPFDCLPKGNASEAMETEKEEITPQKVVDDFKSRLEKVVATYDGEAFLVKANIDVRPDMCHCIVPSASVYLGDTYYHWPTDGVAFNLHHVDEWDMDDMDEILNDWTEAFSNAVAVLIKERS